MMLLLLKWNATVADAIVGNAAFNAYATVVNVVADLDVANYVADAVVFVVGTFITDAVVGIVNVIIDAIVATDANFICHWCCCI